MHLLLLLLLATLTTRMNSTLIISSRDWGHWQYLIIAVIYRQGSKQIKKQLLKTLLKS